MSKVTLEIPTESYYSSVYNRHITVDITDRNSICLQLINIVLFLRILWFLTWALRESFRHANKTSWQSSKLNITILSKNIVTLRDQRKERKKKNVIQARSRGMLSLGTPFTREANWKSPPGQIWTTILYLQLLPAWLAELKSLRQTSQRRSEYHVLNSLAGSGKTAWVEGKWQTCMRWGVWNLWGCWKKTQLLSEQSFIFHFNPQLLLFSLSSLA